MMRKTHITILLCLLIGSILGTPRVDPLVETPKGLLRGLRGNGHYAMFLGVPYGVVDEDNPFGDASIHPGFNSTFEAYHDNIVCPQRTRFETTSNNLHSLQCLLLNIYVPDSASSSNKLPVMVFVHGGGFDGGSGTSSTYNPKLLVEHEVIVVSINYRLGPYGFLCLSIPEYNNQGLKDQLLAFKWIKENIKYFGGDDENMTAFGQSAGAMSLDIHLHTTEGLFKRAIIQSGSALTPFATAEINDTVPIDLARSMGFDVDEVENAMDALKTVNPTDILQAGFDTGIFSSDHPILRPCPDIGDSDKIQFGHPENVMPKVKGMDIIIGHTNKEEAGHGSSTEGYYDNFDFKYEVGRGFKEETDEDMVKRFYLSGNPEAKRREIIDFTSDFTFDFPVDRSFERYIKENANSVYRYVFSYKSKVSSNIGPNSRSEGSACSLNEDEWAFHGEEMQYLFSPDLYDANEDDRKIFDIMTIMWTNFAKYGNPTPSENSELIPIVWPAASANERPYLNINLPLSIEHNILHQRLSFWNVYYKLHATRVKGYRA